MEITDLFFIAFLYIFLYILIFIVNLNANVKKIIFLTELFHVEDPNRVGNPVRVPGRVPGGAGEKRNFAVHPKTFACFGY
jgi:hypothetical protein